MSNLQPAFVDAATGEVFLDTASGEIAGPRRSGRLNRRAQRKAAKAEYLSALADGEGDEDGEFVIPRARRDMVESYRLAGAANLVQENQVNGLGSTAIAASSTGTLSNVLTRTFWCKSLVIDSDDPSSILVTGLSIAGLPINVGTAGMPASTWSRDSTRFMQTMGRRVIMVGQTFLVNLSNVDAGSGHTVTAGLIGDELQPGIAQQAMEAQLIEGALSLVNAG